MLLRHEAAVLSDEDLAEVYTRDVKSPEIGVNYWVAREMEKRGLRNPFTAKLTERGKRLCNED